MFGMKDFVQHLQPLRVVAGVQIKDDSIIGQTCRLEGLFQPKTGGEDVDWRLGMVDSGVRHGYNVKLKQSTNLSDLYIFF